MEREIQGHIANGRVIKDSKRIFSRFLFNSSGGGGGGGSGSSRDFDTFLLLCVTIKFGILLPVAKSRRSACVCVRAFVASSRRLAGEKRREEKSLVPAKMVAISSSKIATVSVVRPQRAVVRAPSALACGKAVRASRSIVVYAEVRR